VRRTALLLSLYFVEGLPFGFQAKTLTALLRSQGVSLVGVGFAGALSLPWLLKALWAPLVDRYGSARFGRRRSWIVPLHALLALTSLAAAAVADQLQPLLACVFLLNLFAATQDIAVDGWAVELLGERELGPGNAAQVVGYKLGMLTSGGLLVWATQWIGWSGLFCAMALFCLLAMGLVLATPESPAARALPRLPLKEVLLRLRQAARLPGTGWLLAVVATYKLGESLVDAMFRPFLIDSGFTPAQLGLWMGTGSVASIAGSLAGGVLAARLPLVRAVAITAAIRVVPLLLQVWLAARASSGPLDPTAVIGVVIAEDFFGGALTTAMFALMMSRVDARIGGTHYTLLASLEVLGKSPGTWASGALAQALGYTSLFGLGALLSLAFLPLLAPLSRPSSSST
jgi:PAT family beta-lactamase induction signal transducer AmpG